VQRFLRNWTGRMVPLTAVVLASIGCQPASAPIVAGPGTAIEDEMSESSEPQAPLEPPISLSDGASAAETATLNLVEIDIPLPAPAFRGTPVPGKEPMVEEPTGKSRPPFLAPEGTVNLARGKPVGCSDPIPAAGELDYVTDGDKSASDFAYLELAPGTQWIQIDLGQRAAIYAVVVWHNHAEARVYRDVVVQVGDDPDLLDAVTVFNNDFDNSSGLGIGSELGYVETSEGKLIDGRGVEGRYVRLYSRGNHLDDKNHYTEVDVYGRPLP